MSLTKAVTQPFVKIYNFIQREFAYTTQIDTHSGFLPFGPADNFPNKLHSLVDGSPTATSCLSTLTDFITGEGFNEGEDLENLKVNSQGLTFFNFHNIQSDNFSHDWGVATLVKYNKLGQITEFFDIPFGYTRLGKPDSKGVISKIHYNPYYGDSLLYKSMDTVVYDVYNPAAAVLQITKDPGFKGQIFWMGMKTTRHPFYPIPDYYSAQHWMNVEKNSGVYFDENLQNGFLTPTILKIFGDPNDPSGIKDANGDDIPKGQQFDSEMTKNFSGAKRVGQIMTFWANNKDEFPAAEAFPVNSNADMHRVTDEHATKKITIATKVPGILANISEGVSLGGDGNTIRAAVKLMQQRVVRPQSFLIAYYQELLANMVNPYTDTITITSYSPFPELETVDPSIWAELSPQERRDWIRDHTEIQLIEETDPALEEPAPEPLQNRITNLHFDTYPHTAKANVKRAIEWQEKMGAKCLKPAGRILSEQILNGAPLGPKEIRRLSRYLSKQTVFKDHPYDQSCESVLYDAWGGSDMMTWANEKVKELKGETD
jgi:hypothetical protein